MLATEDPRMCTVQFYSECTHHRLPLVTEDSVVSCVQYQCLYPPLRACASISCHVLRPVQVAVPASSSPAYDRRSYNPIMRCAQWQFRYPLCVPEPDDASNPGYSARILANCLRQKILYNVLPGSSASNSVACCWTLRWDRGVSPFMSRRWSVEDIVDLYKRPLAESVEELCLYEARRSLGILSSY